MRCCMESCAGRSLQRSAAQRMIRLQGLRAWCACGHMCYTALYRRARCQGCALMGRFAGPLGVHGIYCAGGRGAYMHACCKCKGSCVGHVRARARTCA